jgi:hypothetical protein
LRPDSAKNIETILPDNISMTKIKRIDGKEVITGTVKFLMTIDLPVADKDRK